jgi:hypothetical protein
MNLATFAIAIAMMMDGTGAGLKAPTPDEQFQALRDAHPREGPIQKAWNIQFFPTIYVLDSNGVIRHKNLQEKALDEAVETLLLEAETTK